MESYYLTIIALALITLIIHWFIKTKEIKKLQHKNMLEDLELATSEQLLYELRKRPNFPYMLVLPTKHRDFNSVALEVHSLSLIESFIKKTRN